MTDSSDAAPTTFYDAVGGHETFRQVVSHFYATVATDPVLRPLYPEEDLGPAEQRFLLFLEQYWGGPRTYSDARGHPRLRMRHHPFRITSVERDAWLAAVRGAVATVGPDRLDDDHRRVLLEYLEMAAHSMVNTPG